MVDDRLHAEGFGPLICNNSATELASNRTTLALERTRIAADRTLMAVIRTSLSLISFGFTIYQFLGNLGRELGTSAISQSHARNFGLALVTLGVGMLITGIFVQADVQSQLRDRRLRLHGLGLLRSSPQYRARSTTIFAILLLLVGLTAMIGMIARIGPLS